MVRRDARATMTGTRRPNIILTTTTRAIARRDPGRESVVVRPTSRMVATVDSTADSTVGSTDTTLPTVVVVVVVVDSTRMHITTAIYPRNPHNTRKSRLTISRPAQVPNHMATRPIPAPSTVPSIIYSSSNNNKDKGCNSHNLNTSLVLQRPIPIPEAPLAVPLAVPLDVPSGLLQVKLRLHRRILDAICASRICQM